MNPHATAWDALTSWGDVTLGGAFSTGSMSQVRRVTVGGESVVARWSSRGEDDLQWEIGLLVLLADRGLAVPRLVPTLDGQLRAGGLIVMEHVEGRCAETEDDYELVAAYLSRLHEMTAARSTQRPGWRACAELVTHDQSGPVGLRNLPPDVLDRCRRAWARLVGLPHSVIHGDPNPSNVRVTPSQEIVLLDWDEARLDTSCLDLARPPMPEEASALDHDTFVVAREAFRAWEAAMFWDTVPDHARRQLERIP